MEGIKEELYSIIENKYKASDERIDIPACILDGLGKKYELREYQEKAIRNFIFFMEKGRDFFEINGVNDNEKGEMFKGTHLLFNVATGGGKTLLMACIILYLHNEYNYNNFLFLSNRKSINDKTYENFFNTNSSKYLFSENVNIRQSNFFDFLDDGSINISIESYQGLDSLLNNERENCFSISDIVNKKIVILADESHHLNAGKSKTKGSNKKRKNDRENYYGEWEKNLSSLLNINADNFLIEFTATIDWKKSEYYNKYYNKCIFKYDIGEFYKDHYTKFIDLMYRDVEIDNLMFGAVILSKYRQVLFNEINNDVKPVILFKSETIDKNRNNRRFFEEMIEGLNEEKVKKFYEVFKLDEKNKTKIAFDYLVDKCGGCANLINILKVDFCKENILCTNEEKNGKEEKEDDFIDNNAKLLNSLEEKNNSIRAIFSVDKLNEGWDVLNLFDIVKLYTTKSTKDTIQEAQLLGRGARYCPIEYGDMEKYKRKFDGDKKLEILEQLYFHSKQGSNYIGELKKVLIGMGIELENTEFNMKIKDVALNCLSGEKIFFNEKKKKNLKNIYDNINEQIPKFKIILDSNEEKTKKLVGSVSKELDLENYGWSFVKLADLDESIKWEAIVDNTDYNFEKLYKRLKLRSFSDFIAKFDGNYLKVKNWENTRENAYKIYSTLLKLIYEKVLGKELKKFEGTKEFKAKNFRDIFGNGLISKRVQSSLVEKNEVNLENKKFSVYDKCILTSEEKDFIIFFESNIYKELEKQCFEIYLLRNERKIKLYQFDNGVGFEPDFVLFLKKGNLKYQIYIEPKGEFILNKTTEVDKNRFLEQINKFIENGEIKLKNNGISSVMNAETENYRLVGLPLYNSAKNDEFKKKIEEFVLRND